MKERNFLLYTAGILVSFIGSGVQDVALPLFILDVTGSGKAMGTFMIISTVPRLLLYPVAGVIGDRVNRKWIMVWTDVGRGIVILFLALLASQERLTIPLLFSFQIAVSFMNALFSPATQAMLPDIVRDEELMKATSIVEAVTSFSYLVGPALGGVIYGLWGVEAAFLVNGISFLGSGVSEIFITYPQKTKKLERVQEVVEDLKEGISFIKTHRGLLVLLVLGLVMTLLIGPVLVVLVPYVLRVTLHVSPAQFGVVQTAFMAGLLTGNVVIGSVFAKKKVEKMLTMGLVAHAGVMCVFAVLIAAGSVESANVFARLFCVFMGLGVSTAFVNTPLDVGFQRLTPTEYRARVFSVSGVVIQGMAPLGYGIMGILLDAVPAPVIALCLVLLEAVVISIFILTYAREVTKEFEGQKG